MCDACGTGGVVAGSVGCAVRDMRDLCAPRLPLSDASREIRDFVAAAGVVVPLGGFCGLCRRVLPKGVLGMPQYPSCRLPRPLAGVILPLADVNVSKVPPSLACRFRDGVWCLQELASSAPTSGAGAGVETVKRRRPTQTTETVPRTPAATCTRPSPATACRVLR